MKTHLRTHNDLDAVGSHIILEASGIKLASVEYHGYETIDESVLKFITNEKNYGKRLILADICPTEGVCAQLHKVSVEGKIKVHLFDHHETRAWVKKYDFATVDPNKSGTLLVHNWVDNSDYEEFANVVNAWDLWLTKSPLRKRSENLNSLLGFVGKNAFVKYFLENKDADHAPVCKSIIEHLTRKKKAYILAVITEQVYHARVYCDGWGNKYKVIFASDYISELGNAVLNYDVDQEIDYVCVINPLRDSCSLRARKNDNVSVAKVAKALSGGGHKSAAGFTFLITQNVEKAVAKALELI
jgi:oligoribonuclease NrnB/cAMP/cGMP phosphodiesterase (DHH superfamily)